MLKCSKQSFTRHSSDFNVLPRSRIELQELKDESFRVEQAVEAEESSPTCGNC